ncbi:hypothetical protein CEXT_500961 [Caerostris extrusa]|uniref:Uncharacterized protein n=1 Tax=Caerostris extrusa TaxID=172846 RepID=A0AAV4MAB4_CAEEX|nr:hypothetical protein CEXT_500961 [Caerostris extrusa]
MQKLFLTLQRLTRFSVERSKEVAVLVKRFSSWGMLPTNPSRRPPPPPLQGISLSVEVSRNSKVEEFLWSALLNNGQGLLGWSSLVLLGDSAKMDGGNKVYQRGSFVVGALFKEEICFCGLVLRFIWECGVLFGLKRKFCGQS